MAKHMMYVIDSDHANGEFVNSVYAGEGYPKKSDAVAHLKFFKEHGIFANEKLTISKAEAPW